LPTLVYTHRSPRLRIENRKGFRMGKELEKRKQPSSSKRPGPIQCPCWPASPTRPSNRSPAAVVAKHLSRTHTRPHSQCPHPRRDDPPLSSTAAADEWALLVIPFLCPSALAPKQSSDTRRECSPLIVCAQAIDHGCTPHTRSVASVLAPSSHPTV
jgi:hypothetical protein